MTAIILLFLLGVAMLAADVFVTSFIMAIAGGASMLAGCAVAYNDYGAFSAILAGIIAIILLGATVYVELVIFPRTRLGRGLVVQSASDATSQPPLAPQAVVGQAAEALTTLAPSGYVQVEGRRYEAFCQTGHADKGEALKVVGLDNFRLIVSKF